MSLYTELTSQYLEGSGQTHGNTIEDQVSYMQFLSKTAKDHGLLVGFNNGGAMLAEHKDLIVDGFDYVIVESCVCVHYLHRVMSNALMQ